jgi:hypothetical protein
MLTFLFLTPVVELASIVTQPPRLMVQRRVLRGILEIPLAAIRVLLALLNTPIGFVALSARAFDLAVARAMGERPKEDVVASARIRQGRIEAERLGVEMAERGEALRDVFVRRWDQRFGSPNSKG